MIETVGWKNGKSKKLMGQMVIRDLCNDGDDKWLNFVISVIYFWLSIGSEHFLWK